MRRTFRGLSGVQIGGLETRQRAYKQEACPPLASNLFFVHSKHLTGFSTSLHTIRDCVFQQSPATMAHKLETINADKLMNAIDNMTTKPRQLDEAQRTKFLAACERLNGSLERPEETLLRTLIEVSDHVK